MLVDLVGARLFDHALHIESLRVPDVRRHEPLSDALLFLAKLVPPDGLASSGDIASRFTAGDLVRGFSAGRDELATHAFHLPEATQGVTFAQLRDDLIEATVVTHIERFAFALSEGSKFRRRDELVLRPADHVREASCGIRIARHWVVQEVHELRSQLAQQQALADLIEDVRVFRQPKVCPVVRQDSVPE